MINQQKNFFLFRYMFSVILDINHLAKIRAKVRPRFYRDECLQLTEKKIVKIVYLWFVKKFT
jgi:hypothetical protein